MVIVIIFLEKFHFISIYQISVMVIFGMPDTRKKDAGLNDWNNDQLQLTHRAISEVITSAKMVIVFTRIHQKC
jgi:hypothetical protein